MIFAAAIFAASNSMPLTLQITSKIETELASDRALGGRAAHR